MNTSSLPSYGPVVLRLGVSAVYAWFGVSQLVNPTAWLGLVPDWALIGGMTANTLVALNGTFELILATLLATGFWVRPIATVLAVHLFAITTHLGLSANGVRDFGLSFATLAIALNGNDQLTSKAAEKR